MNQTQNIAGQNADKDILTDMLMTENVRFGNIRDGNSGVGK